MDDIRKIVQVLEDSNIFLKGISKTKNKGGFLGMLLVTLRASLLINMLAVKVTVRVGYRNEKEY